MVGEAPLTRRLAAILAADVAGYSRLMAADEAGTLSAFRRLRAEIIDPGIAAHHGRVVGSAGDSLLVEFASAVDAVQCAVEVQDRLAARNGDLPEDRRMAFRMGVNLGDVIAEGDTIHGDGVNVASRLERLSEPGKVVVSRAIHDQVKGKLAYAFDDLGEHQVKNIAEPIRAFRVEMDRGITRAPFLSEDLSLPSRPSIAVLPFANMSGDPEQEYFSDGITEDIITELSRFKNLLVVARNSSFVFRGQSLDVKQIGRKLGVGYVVEGSVRKAGNRVRVTAQLIEAESGNHIWAERYDRGLEDIFAVQDEIVREIVGAVPGELERRGYEVARAKRPENLTAYDLVLRARWMKWKIFTNFPEVIALYERALSIDAASASAHVGLARIYGYSIYSMGIPWDQALSKTRYHAEQALSVDDNDASIHAMAALAYVMCGEHDLATIHSARSLALNPNDVYVLGDCGAVFGYNGDPRAGVEIIERSGRLQPFTPDDPRLEMLFDCCYMLGDYAKAVEAYQRMRAPVPHLRAAYGAALAQLGRVEEARAAIAASVEHAPPQWDPATFALNTARMCKRREEANRWLEGFRKAGIAV